MVRNVLQKTSKIIGTRKMAGSMWSKQLKHSLFILVIELYIVIGKRNVVQLSEDNWKEMLDKEWMVEL
jgi:hypothetical protein